jgi:hypothetical protein
VEKEMDIRDEVGKPKHAEMESGFIRHFNFKGKKKNFVCCYYMMSKTK